MKSFRRVHALRWPRSEVRIFQGEIQEFGDTHAVSGYLVVAVPRDVVSASYLVTYAYGTISPEALRGLIRRERHKAFERVRARLKKG